jgi:DNA segregation ATPase FtsK/SpoIIIE, S-DNA-T family
MERRDKTAREPGRRDMASRAPDLRDALKRGVVRSGSMLGALGVALGAALLMLALASYRTSDPAMNTAAGGEAGNLIGGVGAWLSDLLLSSFGPAIWLILPLMMVAAVRLWRGVSLSGWARRAIAALMGIWLIGVALAMFHPESFRDLPGGLGGVLGFAAASAVGWVESLFPWPEFATILHYIIMGLFALTGIIVWARSLGLDADERAWLLRKLPKVERPVGPLGTDETPAPQPKARASDPAPRPVAPAEPKSRPVIADRPPAAKLTPGATMRQTSFDLKDRYQLPSIDLLTPAPPSTGQVLDKAGLERNARLLETVLDDFHVKGSIVEVRPGPVVTMYELEPASGIKASRVIQLADDIARNMSALSARVATIPGRTVIGIELPNAKRESVVFHELVASQAFADQTAQLPIILGKNIAGDPVIADLAPMPHLLVAGTTGSGKSVGLNAMICSLLYRLTPDQCRMIVIDPKMLELSIYDDIPHLLAPVVTEPQKAIRALKWAVEQMEDRYRMLASVGVRSLSSFNEKVRAAQAKGQQLGRRVQTGYDAESGQPRYEEEQLDYQPLPQIVVIVDELADLMMTAGKEVEFLIQRLAQKARAAGIHLIMATQRPSVDVITGVIRARSSFWAKATCSTCPAASKSPASTGRS